MFAQRWLLQNTIRPKLLYREKDWKLEPGRKAASVSKSPESSHWKSWSDSWIMDFSLKFTLL